MSREWFIALVVITSVGAFPRDVTAQEGKEIQGTWVPLSGELGGKKYPDEVLKTIKLVVGDGKYTVMVGEQIEEGTLKYDTGKKPKTMDITADKGPNAGKIILAIYELKADTLQVCYDLSGKGRPAAFATEADKPLFLVTYKREKP